jgi:hypothetical protein
VKEIISKASCVNGQYSFTKTCIYFLMWRKKEEENKLGLSCAKLRLKLTFLLRLI